MSQSIMQGKEQSRNEKHRKRTQSQREDRNRNANTVDKAMNSENRNVPHMEKNVVHVLK